MQVLQLGGINWELNYQIPKTVKWEYNAFPLPKKKKHSYGVVIIAGQVKLTAKDWEDLRMLSTPYSIIYLPGIEKMIGNEGRLF